MKWIIMAAVIAVTAFAGFLVGFAFGQDNREE